MRDTLLSEFLTAEIFLKKLVILWVVLKLTFFNVHRLLCDPTVGLAVLVVRILAKQILLSSALFL